MKNIQPVTIGVRLTPEAKGLVDHLSARTDAMWRDESMMPRAIDVEVHTVRPQDDETDRTLYFGRFCLSSHERPATTLAPAQMIGFASSDSTRRFMGMLIEAKASTTLAKGEELPFRDILTYYDRKGAQRGLRPNSLPIQRVGAIVFSREPKESYLELIDKARSRLAEITS